MAKVTIPKKLSGEVKTVIIQAVYEVLNDPDIGLELREVVKRRLHRASISKRKTIPFSEIKRKYY